MPPDSSPVLGVIGGSGLYQVPGLEEVHTVDISTPFGDASSPITIGKLAGTPIAFLARHGVGHTQLPSEVPYRANIFALKKLGVKHVVSISAVGSLREEYAPLDVVVPDQLFDRTKARISTFFGSGIVAHIAFDRPYCPALRNLCLSVARDTGATTHDGGTLAVMEGPAFSTLSESEFHRKQGFSIIGMTALPEAKLAREAELCYATVAMVTDYDAWHTSHGAVTQDMVAANIRKNTAVAHQILRSLAIGIASKESCTCEDSLASAFLTPFELVPAPVLDNLDPIIGKYRRG